MFLSSWLDLFQQVVRRTSRRRSPSGRRAIPRERYLRSSERLEDRCLLILPPTFQLQSPPLQLFQAPALPILRISHASTPGGDPTGLEQLQINQFAFPANQQTPGPYPSQITLTNLFDPDTFVNGTFRITATSADTQIVQGLTDGDSVLDVKIERLNDAAYVRFEAGPGLFGETTVSIQVTDATFDTTTQQVRVRLDDPPQLDPLNNQTVLEDSGPQSIPLTGISAGGKADDVSNGGQNRLIYAYSTKPKLTGIPTVQYDQAAMDKIGTLLFAPIKGQPVDVQRLGDNEATITVTIEDGGIDNDVGKVYDPLTGDLTISNFDATLDNQIRTQSFRFTIVPVNDAPTLDPQNSSNLPNITINEDQASPLTSDVDSTQTTITLLDARLFQSSLPFTVQVDTEQMQVTAISGSTFTVVRAFGGTVAAAHSRGQIVYPSTTLTGITAGGGSSPIGNELQNVSITPTNATNGFYTLTFDDGVHSYTTDLISYNAPATDSRNETLLATANANSGTFTVTLADNIGAVTSLDSAIDNLATTTTVAVDNLTGFPNTTPFVISVDSEEMLVVDVAAAPVSGNPLRKSMTVVRGIHGTTRAAHSDSASVIEVRTEQSTSFAGQLISFLDAVSTSFTLTNPTTLPPVPFLIQVEDEQMQVTAVAGSDLTVTRGVNNTTAATHSGSLASPIRVDTASVLGNLTSTLNAGGTVLVLTNAVALPQAPFTIQLEQEQMRVTGVVGNALTVVRGVNGTTDVAHVGSVLSPLSVTALTAMNAAAFTQLTSAISNATTVITVANGAIFPAADAADPTTWFYIRIDREEMLVNNRATDTLTVVRGANGTNPAAHGGGAAHPVSRVDDVLRVVDSSIFTGTVPYDIRVDTEDMRVTAINGNELSVIRGIHGTLLGAHVDTAKVSSIQTTSPIDYVASASEVQSALSSLPLVGPSGVQVTGGPISPSTPVTIEFIGNLGRTNLDRLTTDQGGLNGNEIQQLNYNSIGLNGSGTAAGTFTLTFGGRTTAPIPFDADATTIEAALTAPGMQPILNPGDVIVRGGPLPTAVTIEFTGQYANTNVSGTAVTANTTQVTNNERQRILFTGSPTGGTFTLRYADTFTLLGPITGLNYTTAAINYDGTAVGTASAIESALESLGSGMDVTVTPVSALEWIVEFTGTTVRDKNHALIAAPAAGNNLNPATNISLTTLEDGDQTIGFSKTLGNPSLVINGLSPTTGIFPQIDGAISVQDALIGLQSLTAADITTSGGDLPGLPVTVEFVGTYAGLDLNLMTINNSPLPLLGLVDFGAAAAVTDDINGDSIVDVLDRHFDGESQKLRVTAVSDNADIVPDPIVNYTSPQGTATLTFTNNHDRFGTATITVTVMDSGFDQKLETVGDNAYVTKTFVVTVLPTNDAPTINALPDVSVPKNTTAIPLSLKGISTGGNETQELRVTASSSNTVLLPNPSVVYSKGASTGLLTLEPIAGVVGFSIVTVTVEDAGIDGSLNSTGDNGVTQITFRLDVSEPPTLGATPTTIIIPEDSLIQNQTLNVTAGGSETQPLRLIVSNTNSTLFPAPANVNITYTSPNPTGTLNFQPVGQLSGSDTFRITLSDGGPDGLLGTPGKLAADLSLTATLLTAADATIFPVVPTNKLALPISRTDTSVTLINAASFPSSASTLNTFKIQVGNEVMTVTNVSGNTFTVLRGLDATPVEPHEVNEVVLKPFKIRIGDEILRVTAVAGSNLSLIRGVDGTLPAQHYTLDGIVHPNSFDNLTITRDIGVTVTPVNDLPTLATFTPNPLTVPEGSGQQIVSLSGITDGETPSASQHLAVSAVSSNPTLTGPITVSYTDGDAIGTLRFTPNASLSGTAIITVTVRDGGLDNNLSTPEANDTFSRNLTVNVVPIGDLPTLTAISNRTLDEGAPFQTVNLAGITDGDNNTQDLLVTATTTNPILISNLTLNYNPSNLQPSTGGAPPTTGQLTFTPGADRFGSANITVNVMDGGNDTRLGVDTITGSTTASGAIMVVVVNPTRFPTAAPFNIVIDNEEMSVSSISGPGGNTFTILAGDRGLNGTTAALHTAGAVVIAPNTYADNVTFSRTFNVTVNPKNDAPRVVAPPATITIPESSPQQTLNVTGIDAGPFEEQALSIKVTSKNTSLIPNPTIFNFTPPTTGVPGSGSAVVKYQPVANRFGTATLTLEIMDAGLDGLIGTLSDNGITTKNINVVVTPVNDAPILDAVPTVTVSEESGQKTVNLTGITAGGGESQILKVTPSLISSSIAGLITNLSLDYTSPSDTGVLKFTPGANLFGTATIRVTVEDAGFDGVLAATGDNATFFRDISVIVGNVVDLPTLAQPLAATINKNGYLINSVTVTGISDGDLNTQTLTVTATSDNPGLVPDPTVNFTQSGTTPSTATQSATLVFNPAVNQLGTANITVRVADGPTSFVTKTFVLTVADVNLPPTIDPATPNPVPMIEDDPTPQAILLSGISAGGTESQLLKVTAVSSDPNAIFIDNTPGTDITYTSPSPTGLVTIHSLPNAAGNFTVTITVTDAGTDGTFGNPDDNSTSTTVDVQIAAGNDDDPTLAAIANKVIGVSGTPTLQTVNLSSISDGPFENGPVSVSIFSNDNAALVPGPTVNYTSGSTGTLTFTPAASTSGVANIVVRVTDGGGHTFDRPFSVFVVNPPTIANITNPVAIPEDTPGTQSVPLSGISDGDSGTEGVQVSASVLNDPSGIIGSLSTTFVNPTDATGSVDYTLATDKNGTATIQVTVKDQGPTVGFSTGDEATVVKIFTVVVTPMNDAPTVTVPATLTLSEDGPTGTINLTSIFAKMGALLDEAGQPLRISAVSADTNKVTVSSVNYTSPQSTGSVIVAPVANAFGGPVNVTITVEDGGTDNNLSTPSDNQSFSQVVAASITAANDFPTLNTIGDVTVNEDSGMGSVNLAGITAGVGESQGLTVTATSDNQFLIPDANLSVIYTSANPTGTLQFTPLADKFGDAFITVTVTDDGSIDGTPKSFSKTFKVHVNAVNDAPEIFGLTETADSTVSVDGTTAFIDENLPVGTEVAVVDFNDEGPLPSLNVSIISGNTGNAFSISNDGTIRVANAAAINFEANPTFTITVKIVDNSPIAPTGLSAQQTFTINLADLSEVLTIGSGNWPASGGLTIKRNGALIEVLNSSVPAHVFANVSQIQVTGRSGTADVLTLDYSGGDPIPSGMSEGLTFNGGAGAGDTIKFANATFGQLDTTFSGPTSAVIDDPAAPISLTGIEAITFNSSVTATNLNFVYGTGNDVVTFTDDGNSDVSTFSANSSPLITFPALAGVTVDVGEGNNSVTFNSIENASGPAVTVLAGGGNDSLRASAVGRAVSLSGGGGHDSLVGGSGADTLDGGEGDDTISGGFGTDQLFGGTGTNTLYESANASFAVGSGTMSGDLGSDNFSDFDFAFLVGGSAGNTINAGGFTGQATINGGGGDDNLTGSSQEDVITGGLGNDTIDGGGGDDTLVESGNVNFLLGDSTMTGLGSDSHFSIEFAVLTGGSGNNTLDASGFGGTVTLFGGAGNDILKGGDGDDLISGDAGNDTLSGNGGTNTLNGGTEIDQVLESADVDFELLAAQLISSLGTDDLISIETAKLVGGNGDNTLNASAFAGKTTLQGGNGTDTLIGGSNIDSLEGGNGDDKLTGGLGNDKLVGGADLDTIVEDDLTGLTMTASSMTATSAAGSSTDTLTSMEAGRFTGTATANSLSGGTFAGALTIDGLEGNDTLTGGAGSDFIYGGAGKDRLSGGAGNDQIDGGTENDSIYGQAGNDVILGGEGNDSLFGGDNDDAIDGQGGDDKVSGENGNDILIGGTGLDSIVGGAGNDKLWSGDYFTDQVNVDDGDKDTLISGTGTDTVKGEAGLDVITDASNTAAEKAAVFAIDYDSIFGALLGS